MSLSLSRGPAALLLVAGLAAAGAPARAQVDAVARARADSTRYPYTAADVRFMQMMIGHHSQAIVMSRMAPTHGASPAVQRLAARIINAQQDEIATMQQWLRVRNLSVPGGPPAADSAMAGMAGMSHDAMAHGAMHDMPGMTPDSAHARMAPAAMHGAMSDSAHAAMHAAEHGGAAHGAMAGMDMGGGMAGMDMPALMPGMLTSAQLRELDAARGAAFDERFLRFMIQHHTGATSMVSTLFDTYGAAQDETVFKFASDVNVDQTTEIARMQRMLAVVVLGIPDPDS